MVPARIYGHWKAKKRGGGIIRIQCDDSLYKRKIVIVVPLTETLSREYLYKKISVTLNSLLEREGCVFFLDWRSKY